VPGPTSHCNRSREEARRLKGGTMKDILYETSLVFLCVVATVGTV
jgi:hypothetical protein